jgi:hypothetical protein
MSPTTAFILTCSLVLSGCGAAAPRKPIDSGKVTQKAVHKIDRICALPPAERDAQLKKLEAETGVVLVCSK